MENKELVAVIKEKGLEGLEDVAEVALKEAIELIEAIVLATDNKFDDMVVGPLKAAHEFIKPYLDKIDGKEG